MEEQEAKLQPGRPQHGQFKWADTLKVESSLRFKGALSILQIDNCNCANFTEVSKLHFSRARHATADIVTLGSTEGGNEICLK